MYVSIISPYFNLRHKIIVFQQKIGGFICCHYIIKQNNHTKLKFSVISLCGLDNIWDLDSSQDQRKNTFLQNFVFVGLWVELLHEVNQSNQVKPIFRFLYYNNIEIGMKLGYKTLAYINVQVDQCITKLLTSVQQQLSMRSCASYRFSLIFILCT